MSKKHRGLLGTLCCPQIVMMRGEWSKSFLTEATASILPPLSSKVWETINLSILETAEVAPVLPLSYVYSFFDNFRKLSMRQASTSPSLIIK